MIEAVDPYLTGALPCTILVEPAGKIASQSPIDVMEMKTRIVENKLIGRFCLFVYTDL